MGFRGLKCTLLDSDFCHAFNEMGESFLEGNQFPHHIVRFNTNL